MASTVLARSSATEAKPIAMVMQGRGHPAAPCFICTDTVYRIDIMIPWYHDRTMTRIVRVQTGLRLEKRLLKVMKGLAEHLEISVAELVEAMALHAFEGKQAFSDDTMAKIAQLKAVYDLDIGAADSHCLSDGAEKETGDDG